MDNIEKALTKNLDERAQHFDGLTYKLAYGTTLCISAALIFFFVVKWVLDKDAINLNYAVLLGTSIIPGIIAHYIFVFRWKISLKEINGKKGQ